MDQSPTRYALPKAITAFGLELYKKLNTDGTCKNIFYSPLSISAALGMILLGARGNSKTQMERVLHFATTKERGQLFVSTKSMRDDASGPAAKSTLLLPKEEEMNEEFKNLLFQLNNLSKAYQLSLANNLFIQNGFQFLQQYLANTQEIYRAILQSVDFCNATEEARQTINLVVERQTQGNIKELFAPDIIGPETVLVLANAIYFKATWQHQFDPEYTKEKDFRLNENESKPVQMMFQKGTFKLGQTQEKNAQLLCLPYLGDLLSMIIILPNSIGNLEQVERSMTCENLARWTASENMSEHHVEMYIPRFKLEDSFDLNLALQALGMTDVFNESKADLSGMSPSRQLFLSKVMHKAYVDVNEVGTEAAAATGAACSTRSLIEYELFLADHPFLFCICHNPTNTVLFLGKLCCP